MSQKYILSALLTLSCCLSTAGKSDLAISVRTGLDLTSYHTSPKFAPMLAETEHFPMGNITIGVDKELSSEFSAGISSTYNYLYIPAFEISVPILRSSAHANYHLSKASQIGLSASIAHVNVKQYNYLFGYINHLMLGLNIKNYISEQIFTHIELIVDATPSQTKSIGLFPLHSNALFTSHGISSLESSPYIASISVGYDFDLENINLEKLI